MTEEGRAMINCCRGWELGGVGGAGLHFLRVTKIWRRVWPDRTPIVQYL
jgi:hypothetical protein